MSRAAWLIHAGAIGDFVLTLSIVQALRRIGYDDVRVLGRLHYAHIATPADGVTAVRDIDAAPWHRLFGDEPRDAVATLVADSRAELIVDTLGISKRAADDLRSAGVAHVVRLDPRPRPGCVDHITKQWEAILRSQQCDLSITPPRIGPGRRARDTKVVVLHVGSGGQSKCWPIERWVELAKQLQRDGDQVTFPLGPAELENPAIVAGRARLEELGAIVESPSLVGTRTLIAAAGAFVGNDSGPTHLAAALGTPTLAVFGETDPRIWGPQQGLARCVGHPGHWPAVADVCVALADLRLESGE